MQAPEGAKRRRRGRPALLLASALGLAACSAASARERNACDESAVLALIGGVEIGLHDLRIVQTRVRAAGGAQSDREALIDVLWQERARQDRGLPGGSEIHRSRRRVVSDYRNTPDGPESNRPRFVAGQAPGEAILTDCGRRLLEQTEGS